MSLPLRYLSSTIFFSSSRIPFFRLKLLTFAGFCPRDIFALQGYHFFSLKLLTFVGFPPTILPHLVLSNSKVYGFPLIFSSYVNHQLDILRISEFIIINVYTLMIYILSLSTLLLGTNYPLSLSLLRW